MGGRQATPKGGRDGVAHHGIVGLFVAPGRDGLPGPVLVGPPGNKFRAHRFGQAASLLYNPATNWTRDVFVLASFTINPVPRNDSILLWHSSDCVEIMGPLDRGVAFFGLTLTCGPTSSFFCVLMPAVNSWIVRRTSPVEPHCLVLDA